MGGALVAGLLMRRRYVRRLGVTASLRAGALWRTAAGRELLRVGRALAPETPA